MESLEDRLTRVEQRQADLDVLLAKLVTFARIHPSGRILLKCLGLK